MRQAAKHGADPELLADSRSFMTKLTGSTRSARRRRGPPRPDQGRRRRQPGVQAQPGPAAGGSNDHGGGQQGNGKQGSGSKTTAPPARSGGEHNSSPGGNRQWTEDNVDRATPDEVGAAREASSKVALEYQKEKSASYALTWKLYYVSDSITLYHIVDQTA